MLHFHNVLLFVLNLTCAFSAIVEIQIYFKNFTPKISFISHIHKFMFPLAKVLYLWQHYFFKKNVTGIICFSLCHKIVFILNLIHKSILLRSRILM